MPIYDWKCQQCGHEFETLAMSGAISAPCPACNTLAIKRPCATKSYTIKGNNSASVTPRRYRGGNESGR